MYMQLHLIVSLLIVTRATGEGTIGIVASSRALPGCEDRCANIWIPFPFGTREGCYLEEKFLLTCNTTYKPPRLFLGRGHIEVTDIFLQGQLRILSYTARDCYNETGLRFANKKPSTRLGYFLVSPTRNKFTAVGCDTYALVTDSWGQTYTTGCMSMCNSIDNVIDGSCSGTGCCEIAIPKGVRSFNITVGSYYNHTYVRRFNPCSFAFLAEEGTYNFSSSHLKDYNYTFMSLVMLDWAIGDQTCHEARKNLTSYACKENSNCYNVDNGVGYRCNCSEGYEGNPYLPNGCTDINECSFNPSPCNMPYLCHNLPGRYECSCPKGYDGDGKKYGSGCRRLHNKRVSLNIIALGVCAGVGGFLLLGAAWRLDKLIKKISNKKRKEKFFKRNGGFLLQKQLSSSEGNVEKTKVFNSKELKKATDHYNKDRILGQGGQGTVYKGMLSDGRIVAIKKSKMVDEGNIEQFINEVSILSQINHRNVVKLLGCCLETEVPLLVYEFIPKGALFQHIHDPNEEFPLLWEARLRIATETAEALYYLHYAASIPIYHRDIKSANILLDDKYKAKVSDFGTSRSVTIEQTHLTTLVKGTFGYLDPEYFQSSQFTDKSDVYSFGVVLVELLTGEKPIMYVAGTEERRSLATYFIQSVEENRLLEILDPRILKEGPREEMEVVAHVAKRCLNLNGKKRPTMKEMAVELEGIRTSGQGSTTLHHD